MRYPLVKDYTSSLDHVIKQMLRPIKNIPLNLVIESICGYKILPFNNKDPKDREILVELIKIAKNVSKEINVSGIKRKRVNEVGNDIEIFVKNQLNKNGFKADIPRTKNGKRKATGYPDIEFVDKFNRINYLECKTFNFDNQITTQRSFYLSPCEEFKVTHDAHHFAMSFEMEARKKMGDYNLYFCNNWKILDLEKLDVDVKYEFNADNKRLYEKSNILAEPKK